MSVNLFLHNIGFIISSVSVIAIIVLVYLKDHKKIESITLMLGMGAVGVFTISHLFGVNVSDPHFSRNILMANLANIFISLFLAHCVFAVMGKLKEQRIPLAIIYALSISLFVFYLIFPDTFLLDSRPKLYFPNYYVAGDLHWAMRLFSNTLVPLYFLMVMIRGYKGADSIMKNRLKYFFLALAIGYIVGSTAILLVFDIPFDPMWASPFMGFFAIPFAYAVLKYELLDITIVAKRAFVYSILVVLGALLVGLLNFLNGVIVQYLPDFPIWLTPLISSVIGVGIGFLVWLRIREADTLKYEFITVVTHKFRTPLTHIKWVSEELEKKEADAAKKKNIADIQTSVYRLNELTDLLVGVSRSEDKKFLYKFELVDFSALVKEFLNSYESKFQEKQLKLTARLGEHVPAKVDEMRIRFALQILLDNAVNYTRPGGEISVNIWQEGEKTLCAVRDSGIGISKEEKPHIFERFYRGTVSKHVDTEGMGLGLFMAKQIIERHEGRITAESEGADKGSTFTISLPSK